ncbi:hypothetical protein [Winogradskyella sp.]|uniref:hypothetical protein n=1 Tax=Winogradskyella sp. TaxID=1883156 RepID=UPI00351898EB
MALISAPTVILSIDNSADVSIFYSITEEEENEKLNLVIEDFSSGNEELFLDESQSKIDGYTYKIYTKPHLNLISPPPEFIS